MANITILQEPASVSPAYNNLVYKVSSINVAQPNFKFIADVQVAGQSFRLFKFPDPTFNTGSFNVSKIVQSYIQGDIDKATFGFQENVLSEQDITVQFGEEYGASSSGTTVFPNQIESSATQIWNSVIDTLPFANYNKADFVMNTSSPIPFLTNAPSGGLIRANEDAWLYGLTETSGTVYHAKIITYDSAGSTIQTVKVNNPFQSIPSTNSKYIRFSCGTNNLNSIPSSGITDGGAQPIITSSVASYDITFQTFAGVEVSIPHTFNVSDTCTKNPIYRFHFLNKLGGYDSYSFIRASTGVVSVERNSFTKVIGNDTSGTAWGYSTRDRGRTAFSTKVDEVYNG